MVRNMEVKDIKAVEELGTLINENFIKVYNLENMLEESVSRLYVYEEDEEVLGFLMATVLYDNADLLNIAVKKEYQRKHIAEILMDYFISDLKNTVKVITLEVRVDNTPAICLYEKFGFKKIHTRKKYYHGIDAYLMGRNVEE